jgi:hypothetical protein
MNIDNFLLSPVKLKFNQDWTPALNIAQKLIDRVKTQHSDVRVRSNTTFYDLGPIGSVGHHHISDDWHTVTGDWTTKYLTWLPKLLADTAELVPQYSINIMNGNGAEHTDFPDVPTALNYPLNTTGAETYLLYEGQEYCHPSLIDQPWLINTQYPHGVRNTECRLVFNMHFAADYVTVKKWFDQRPSLVYGN